MSVVGDRAFHFAEQLEPGDVVLSIGKAKLTEPHLAVAYAAIRAYQKRMFCGSVRPRAEYRQTHVTQYFPRWGLFSVEAPRCVWKSPRCYAIEAIHRGEELSIWRPRTKYLDRGLPFMLDSAQRMIGTKYDYGQLLDIGINGILGYDGLRKLHPFDLGRDRKVCSVGVRINFEYARHQLEKQGVKDLPRLFSELNPGFWTPEEQKRFKGVDVEATPPAIFANSRFYADEFLPAGWLAA